MISYLFTHTFSYKLAHMISYLFTHTFSHLLSPKSSYDLMWFHMGFHVIKCVKFMWFNAWNSCDFMSEIPWKIICNHMRLFQPGYFTKLVLIFLFLNLTLLHFVSNCCEINVFVIFYKLSIIFSLQHCLIDKWNMFKGLLG